MATIGADITHDRTAADLTARRFRILLVLAVLVTMFNILDRQVLNILAEPIKKDLNLSDTELGLLTGFSFATFYSLAGLPIARYIDRPRSNRPAVIALCLGLWSAMTMVCGMATSFIQLAVGRMLVAVGESGGGPAVITLINHYVSSANRSRAFGIYSLGIPLGSLVGLMFGGWLADNVGWRAAFLIVGAPGILLALVVWLVLHEPRRVNVDAAAAAVGHPSLAENFLVIIRSPALLCLTAAVALGGLVVSGLPSWTGIYLIRILKLSPTEAGTILGLIMGSGAVGTYFGGVLADRLARLNHGRALLVPFYGLLAGVPAAVIAFLTDDWHIFVAFYWIVVVGAVAYLGPFFSVVQLLVDERHRATTIVIIMMLFNLVGVGLGSLLIGLCSDLLNPHLGDDALRWVLIGGHLLGLVPAFFYLKAKSLACAAIAAKGDVAHG
ncbi:MAG: spinster family MFS transporter [Sphingobium sp.]